MPVLKAARVINFQTIESTYLEFGSFTTLIGDGDAGKSSFLRALRAALLNDASDLDIREGEARTEVELRFSCGTIICWSKARGKGGEYRAFWPD